MPAPERTGLLARLAARDPGNLALGRAVRATIVGPVLFAFALEVLDAPAVAATAVFGALASLVFADFGGPPGERVRAYLLLGAAGGLLLALGTLVSGSLVWAVPTTFVVSGAVRFSGNLGPRWSAAVSPLILALMLGTLVPAPASLIPDRVAGWVAALVVAAVASALILPKRSSSRIEGLAAGASDRLAAALRTSLHGDGPARAAALADVRSVRAELRTALTMPSRPSGPGARDMARREILDRLARLARLLDLTLAAPAVELTPEMQQLGELGAQTLDGAAAVLRRAVPARTLEPDLRARDEARDRALDRLVRSVAEGEPAAAVLERADAGFLARVGSWHADAIARNVAFLAGDVDDAVDGREDAIPDPSLPATLRRVDRLLRGHAGSTSVWFRDAARAGIALAVAVFVAQAFAVDHGFWVALGTLSVLRSSALETGQSTVEAALGTAVGFALSSAVLALVGLGAGSLWVLFVVAVFCVGYLPQVAGFAAGQAAFTVAIVALFNLLEPEGWHTGLTRLEDVVLGASVSAIVALLFWPRRVLPLVARLCAEFSRDSGDYFVDAVRGVPDAELGADRVVVGDAEARVRAAVVDLIAQHRHAPEKVSDWIGRVGVAAHVRSAADAVVIVRDLLPGPSAPPRGFEAALVHGSASVSAALAPGTGAPHPALARGLADRTRPLARTAIAEHPELPEHVVRLLLERDWLLTVAQMVDERP